MLGKSPLQSGPLDTSVEGSVPALVHAAVDGVNTSEFLPFQASTVKTCPLGSSDQPSSELMSALPVPTACQPSVLGLNSTVLVNSARQA